MLILNQKGKNMDVSLNPQFLTDLGMLVQIVFPKPTQSFMAKDEIICVLESNRKLMSIRNPFEGVFRAFNAVSEQLPEKYTADQVLFSVQPMTMDDYKKEQAEKLAKATAKKATRTPPQPIEVHDDVGDWRIIEDVPPAPRPLADWAIDGIDAIQRNQLDMDRARRQMREWANRADRDAGVRPLEVPRVRVT